MARSQKTVNMDTIMVETLYNRGVPLSTSQTYIATVSPLRPYVPPVLYTTTTVPGYTTTEIVNTTTETNVVTTLAGGGGGTAAGFSNGRGTNALFNYPVGVAIDSSSNVYVADTQNSLIRKITPQGEVTTLAGGGISGNTSGHDDGNGTNASFWGPSGVAIDSSSNVYITTNHSIRMITPSGNVTTLAGSGYSGFSNGNGTNALFSMPSDVALDSSSNIYVADFNNKVIRKITPSGNVTTFASGFSRTSGVALDSSSNVYVADFDNCRILIIYPGGTVSILAGGGISGNESGSNDGVGTNALFNGPYAVAIDSSSNVYVADSLNNKIRIIYPGGTVSTLAGGGISGSTYGSDNGNGTNASFWGPYGITVDSSSNVYVADTANNLIRKITQPITLSNYVTTIVPAHDVVSAVLKDVETYSSRDCAPMIKPSQAQFLQWTNQPLSTIYDNYFHGVNPKDLVDQLAVIQKEGEPNMNAYTMASNTIISLSDTTIQAYSTIAYANTSTINSYDSTLLYYNSNSLQSLEYLSTILENASSILVELSTNFYTTQFLPYATTLIERGDYYYLQRPSLPTPVPWYWQGFPSRYIGPGLSSMYISTVLNQPLLGSYINLLSSTSTSCGWLNSTTIGNVTSFENYAYTVFNYVDTGSSISTAYGDSCSTFEGHLQTEFYGTDVSTISTFVSDYFTQYSIPTDGPSISTGASSMFQMLSDLNSITLDHISSGVLGDPISTFSTIAGVELLSVQTTFLIAQDYPTISSLYGDFSTIIVSTATLVSLSTNVAGYQTMSTLAQTTFSTFSTIFPVLLGYDILTTTSTLSSQLAVFSSILVPQNSTIYGLNSRYIAAPGVSSLYSDLSTYTEEYYISASAQISTQSTILQYSTLIYQTALDSAAEWYSSITVLTDYTPIVVNTRLLASPVVTTLAGGGGGTAAGFSNDRGTNALFDYPYGVAVDSSSNVYVADSRNNLIRMLSPLGVVTTFAGGFNNPDGVAIDSSSNIYVADTNNNIIRMISPLGAVTTLAGSGQVGNNNGNGTNARFKFPRGVAVDSSSNVYVADTGNNIIRMISPLGAVTTLAGGGSGYNPINNQYNPGSNNGDGTNASFNLPFGVAVDSSSNVYIADSQNSLIRTITPQGKVTTLAGGGVSGSTPGSNDGNGTNALFDDPTGITVDSSSNVYVAEYNNNLIRKITPQGKVTTLAGGGISGSTYGYSNGNGTNALFMYPTGIALDSSSNLYVADSTNNLIRKIAQYETIYNSVFNFTSIQTIQLNGNSDMTVSTLGVQNSMTVQGHISQVGTPLSMSNIAIYGTDSDVPYILGTKQIQAKVSSILFNSSFTIYTPTTDQTTGRQSTLVGINTTTPAYALDIASGDARKPTGTQWINPSDERIKADIHDADIETVIKQISSLRLVSYKWSSNYRKAHGLSGGTMLGFLSQEVEDIFPGSVSSAAEEGFADFKSLNTDQIAKAKFALTRHLLSKVSTLEAKVLTLT